MPAEVRQVMKKLATHPKKTLPMNHHWTPVFPSTAPTPDSRRKISNNSEERTHFEFSFFPKLRFYTKYSSFPTERFILRHIEEP